MWGDFLLAASVDHNERNNNMDKVLLMVGLGVSALQDLRWKKVWLPLLWGITTILLLKNFLVSNKGFSWFLCAIFFL